MSDPHKAYLQPKFIARCFHESLVFLKVQLGLDLFYCPLIFSFCLKPSINTP